MIKEFSGRVKSGVYNPKYDEVVTINNFTNEGETVDEGVRRNSGGRVIKMRRFG
jgi:hypothetical protein